MFASRKGSTDWTLESIRELISQIRGRGNPAVANPETSAVVSSSESGIQFVCAAPTWRLDKSEYPGISGPVASTTADEPIRAISPGGTATGVIDTAGDVDYFNISLVAGQTYSISLRGTGNSALIDSWLTLSGSGVTVSDDDGGTGTNSLLTFTATTSGTYQIAVEAYPSSGLTGGYTLDVREMGTDSVAGTRASATPIAVDSTTLGFVESSGDVDMYEVTLVAGQYYSFDLAGGADYNTDRNSIPRGELDTVLTLFDANGNQIAFSDDLSSDDLSSGFGFMANVSGTYYVQVNAGRQQVGGYVLAVDEIDLATLDPLETIDWGTQVASNTVTVYFAAAGEVFDDVTSDGWTQYEIDQAMAALQTYADVSNLTFSITTNAATATFKLVTTTSSEFLGYFNPPGTASAGVGVFATNGSGWNTTGGLEAGGYGFITLVHEFGHGLGLSHPHDNGGTSSVMPGVTSPFNSYGVYDLNQGVYTTMSYNDGWQLHPNGGSPSLNYGYQSGPSALDIALIQQKYGAPSHNAGNNVYYLPTANAAGTFWDVIWDTGGNDSLRHTGTVSARIDLTAATLDYSATGGGVISYVNGVYGGFTIAAGVVIENASGGSGADVLLGNHVANILNGGAGADTMQGRLGNDIYRVDNIGDVVTEAADEGIDRVVSSVSFTLTDNVENLTLVGSAGLSGTGNALNNVLVGNAGANSLAGNGGNDTLNGGGGADALIGGTGDDSYVVDNALDVVTELAGEGNDLVRSNISYTLGENLERLILTGNGATSGTGNAVGNGITGNNAANTLRGEGGSDVILGSGGGDNIYGGVGNDRLTGGVGYDNFYFDTALDATSNVDKIVDFAAWCDSIYLDSSVFSGIAATGTLSASAFRLGTAAADADDRIIYDQATGNIYYDADGNGAGAAVLFAQLTAGANLTNADFIIY